MGHFPMKTPFDLGAFLAEKAGPRPHRFGRIRPPTRSYAEMPETEETGEAEAKAVTPR